MSATAARTALEPKILRAAARRRRDPSLASPYLVAALASIVLAALSLLYPSAPAYDPLAWVVWGRELVHLQLHTVGGPTWKPLPVLFTTAFAPFGRSAPLLWLLVARTGGLMAIAMAATLAARLCGGPKRFVLPATAVAVIGLLTLSGFADSVAVGESEGLLAALCLLAIHRHLDGSPREAFALSVAAGLIRPETWPFIVCYAFWLWRSDPRARALISVALVAIPVLWFVPDLFGSGSLIRGVEWARFDKAASPAHAHCPFCAELTGSAWPLFSAPFKVGAALAAGLSAIGVVGGRARAVLLSLLGVGLAWVLEEAIFTQAGFSGSDRYLIAPVVLLIVVSAAGWGLALRKATVHIGVAAVLATVGLWLLTPPGGPHLGRTLDQLRYQSRLEGQLRSAIAHSGGARRMLRCGPVQTNPSEVPLVAWVLSSPLRSAESLDGPVVIRTANGPHSAVVPQSLPRRYRELARESELTVLSRCG